MSVSSAAGYQELIASVARALRKNSPAIRRKLAQGGRLHVDQLVPFLCVYRRPVDEVDAGTGQLLLGMPSYLTASADPAEHQGVAELCREILSAQREAFGACLLLQIWAARPRDVAPQAAHDFAFRIVSTASDAPGTFLEALEDGLLLVGHEGRKATVALRYQEEVSPPQLQTLFTAEEIETLQCSSVGLEVSANYRDPRSGALFPVELQAMRKGLTQALKRALYAFAHARTTHRPAHYHELGRRAVTEAVRRSDRCLAAVSDGFDLILHVTPVNTSAAWEAFRSSGFERAPEFLYRPRPVEPDLLKRQLYEAPLENIEDPSLAHLFSQKRDELDLQLTLIAQRNTARFRLCSRALYGDVDAQLLRIARSVIQLASTEYGAESYVDAEQFAASARTEIDAYRQLDPRLLARVEVRDDFPGLLVSNGNLLIGKGTRVRSDRVAAMLAHEVDTHMLTYFNGQQQTFREFYVGMAGYEPLQEGLAVMAEYLVGGLDAARLRILGARVLAVHLMTEGADFVEVFRALRGVADFAERTAFHVTMRVFRGGGFTKDLVYLRGLTATLDYLSSGGELKSLYVGKISSEHLDLVEELLWRRIIKPPRLTPRFLDAPQVQHRLNGLRGFSSVLDLVRQVS